MRRMSSRTSRPLEPDSEELERWMTACQAFVSEHLARLPEMPSWDTDGADEAAQAFREPVPEEGRPMEELLSRLDPAIRKSFNTAGPGYLAFIPGGGIPSAGLADFIA